MITYRVVQSADQYGWVPDEQVQYSEDVDSSNNADKNPGIPKEHLFDLLNTFWRDLRKEGHIVVGPPAARALPGLFYHVVSSNGFLQEGYPAPYFDDPEVAVVNALESLKDIVKDIKSPRLFIMRRWPELSYNPKAKGWCFTVRLAVISTEWTEMNRAL